MIDDPNLLLAGAVSLLALIIGAYLLFGKPKKPTVLPLDDFKSFPLIRKDGTFLVSCCSSATKGQDLWAVRSTPDLCMSS